MKSHQHLAIGRLFLYKNALLNLSFPKHYRFLFEIRKQNGGTLMQKVFEYYLNSSDRNPDFQIYQREF